MPPAGSDLERIPGTNSICWQPLCMQSILAEWGQQELRQQELGQLGCGRGVRGRQQPLSLLLSVARIPGGDESLIHSTETFRSSPLAHRSAWKAGSWLLSGNFTMQSNQQRKISLMDCKKCLRTQNSSQLTATHGTSSRTTPSAAQFDLVPREYGMVILQLKVSGFPSNGLLHP